MPDGGSEVESGAELGPSPVTQAVCVGCGLLFAFVWVGAIVRADDQLWAGVQGLWLLADGAWLRQCGALDAVRVWEHAEWWRVLTAGALHGSWLHVGLNGLALWSVGRFVERAVGAWRFGAILVVSSVVACLASLAAAEAALVVGISGGVFGVAGALWWLKVFGPARARASLLALNARELGFWLLLWIGVGFALPFVFGGPALIAQSGHVGGLVAGIVGAVAFGVPRGSDESAPRRERWWSIVAGVGLTVMAGSLALLGAAPEWSSHYGEWRGYAALDDQRFSDAVEAFGEALVLRPADPELLNARAFAAAELGAGLDTALDEVQRALEIAGDQDPRFLANAKDTEGWILCRMGRTVEGLVVLEEARSLGNTEGMELTAFDEHLSSCASADGGQLKG